MSRKQVADVEHLHKRLVHLERIKKIKDRKPGTSNTLDNTPPEVIEAMYVNPRKVAKKKEFNRTTEQENKCLLQRISKILTAPPKITDADYKKMRALCPSTKGLREKYEQAIVDKHHAAFMEHLKTMGPYYKAKEWENDYRKQLRNQKFMRQVNYKRPKGFVDIFAPPKEAKVDDRERVRSAAHANRIRQLKLNESSASRPKSAQESASKSSRAPLNKARSQNSFDRKEETEVDHQQESFEEYSSEQDKRTQLACVNRIMKVEGEEPTSFKGEVACYLSQEQSLIIQAVAVNEIGGMIEAEAEIDLSDLLAIKGLPGDVLNNTDLLESLAIEIVNDVSIKIENEEARIILKVLEPDNEDGVDNNVSAKLLSDAYDECITLTKGVVLDLHISKILQTSAFLSKKHKRITTHTFAPHVSEKMSAVAKISHSYSSDKGTIEVFFIHNSYNKCSPSPRLSVPIIQANSKISTTFVLPSIIIADKALIKEYFDNLCREMHVHFIDNENKLSLKVSAWTGEHTGDHEETITETDSQLSKIQTFKMF